ncbi:MAG: GNAT family N-acetyltransferase [Wenzhouxiangellaceae bacterium]|nr:GNAT family N-acetyltransferase [Wenzhouxiangellaceae bacterium]
MPKIAELVRNRLPDLMKSASAKSADVADSANIRKSLARLLPDEALLLAIDQRKLTGVAALDLDHARLMAMYLDPKNARADTARDLIEAIENTARSFGIQRLDCTVKPQAWAFMERMGYRATGLPDSHQPVNLSKRLLDDASPGHQDVARLHRDLGIAANYGVKHRLRIIEEAPRRVSIGPDIFSRDTELTAEAAAAWKAMQADARRQNADLKPVSGYRSVAYQAELIRKKLVAGRPIDKILATSAAPGYSEHHAACALDITAPGITPLTQEFSMTRAYEWLKTQAGMYGFQESYPNQNRHRIEWEPWHWCYRKGSASTKS